MSFWVRIFGSDSGGRILGEVVVVGMVCEGWGRDVCFGCILGFLSCWFDWF